jgi:2-C-methyl-D-erythritol 4-phosphate cytidylyltransferase/2-C-methyl-D-erythritol 2,4-cyclodiphosphate synthase
MEMGETTLPPIHLIILAGGQSARARRGDSTPPKQFRRIGGEMLLTRSVRELAILSQTTTPVATLTVTAPEPWHPVVTQELEGVGLTCPWHLAPAGSSRTASTWQAVTTLVPEHEPMENDLVAVHDAARPFATHHLLHRLALAAAAHGGAVPGVPVADTIVQMQEEDEDHVAARYLERGRLRALQTPQVFRWADFYAAHRWCHEENLSFTDDGGLLAAQGLTPVVVMGEQENWKITTEGDLTRATEALRTG